MSTTLHSFFNQTGTRTHLPISLLSILLLILLKPLAALSNLSISKLSISDFKVAKSAFLANLEETIPVAFLSHILQRSKIKLIQTVCYFYYGNMVFENR